MSHSWQDDFLGRTITSKLIRNNYARVALGSSRYFSKETHGSKAIALRLRQNVNDCAALVHGTPQIMLHAVDFQEHFIQKPFVAQLGPPPLQLGSIRSSERIAPATDRFRNLTARPGMPSSIPLLVGSKRS